LGKTADNELLKLRATRCNNIAVGLALAGVLVPLVYFMQHMGDIGEWMRDHPLTNNISGADLMRIVMPVAAAGFAWYGAYYFWRLADRIIKRIQD
jgi:hypothetical protein